MPALAPTIAAPPVAGKAGPTRTEIYAGEVLPPNSDALRSLPAGVDPQRFRHSLQIAVMQNPRLLDVDPRLTFREVAKAASLGLFLDPQLGEAYLVISRNNRTGRDEPQLRVGYRGLLRLARQAGDLSLVYAQPVHANDPFKVSYGDSPRLIHEPDPFSNDRGPIIGFYAFAQHRNGDFEFETMSRGQIDVIRDMSDGYRAFKAGRIKTTPWHQHYDEMARKTVLRRLLKRLPASPELIRAQRVDDGEIIDDLSSGSGRTALSASAANAGPGNGQRMTTAEALQAIATGADRSPAGEGIVSYEDDATNVDAGPVDEVGILVSEDDGSVDGSPADTPDGTIDDEAGMADEPDSDEVFPVDAASGDYRRGVDDRRQGIRKCVIKAIREDEARFTNWLAGWNAEGEAMEAQP